MVEAEVWHDPRAEVLHDDIRIGGQGAIDLLSVRVSQVDDEAALTPVQIRECPLAPPQIHRTRSIGAARPLDLDYLGTQSREQPAGPRPRPDHSQVKHAHAG